MPSPDLEGTLASAILSLVKVYRIPNPGSFESLTLDELPIPKPAAGQVLVRMRAASLNFRDLAVIQGKSAHLTLPANLVPLSDGAGEVVECAADAVRFKPQDRVTAIFMQGWLAGDLEARYWATALGGGIDGTLAEYRVFDEEGLVHLPSHLSFEEGATLPCAAVTAWNALYGPRPLRPGESVLTLGTGGVSIFALQFARAAGARVIATSSSDAKLATARQMGAAETINYGSHPEWQKEVRRLTAGRGVDHVIECGGGGTLKRSIGATRVGGSVHLIGVLTQGQINPAALIVNAITLRGVVVGSRDVFEAMNTSISVNRLRPVIDRVFPFVQARQAYHHLSSGTHLGKVVIQFD